MPDVERQSQKGIMIGKGGERLKGIGIAARQRIDNGPNGAPQ